MQPAPPPAILYEDNHLLVLNKPAGMPSQGDESGDMSALDWAKDYIKAKYNKPGDVYLGLVHRLDRPVAGIMVFARTSKAAARLSEQFRTRTAEKTYWAVTEQTPNPPTARLEHWLLKAGGKNIVRAHKKEVAHSQRAVLDYQVLKSAGKGRALVQVKLETGRRHQIRAQLGAIACPICGDVKYGKTEFLPGGQIALCAVRLAVQHPTTGQQLVFEQAPPAAEPWIMFH